MLPPVVFWRKPPFAATGRLFASGYSALQKYLGMYGLMSNMGGGRGRRGPSSGVLLCNITTKLKQKGEFVCIVLETKTCQ